MERYDEGINTGFRQDDETRILSKMRSVVVASSEIGGTDESIFL